MKTQSESDQLNEKIAYLEFKQSLELLALKEQFELTYDGLKPLNVIKNVFSEIVASPDIKGNLLSNAIGLATGYLSRRLLLGATSNPIKKIGGALLQFIITNVVTKESEAYQAKETIELETPSKKFE